uniref:Uncharacterized protein n=1 Tax=Anguilla anguilla TaxID=7936 RepID=A0A0E9WVU8_ANGAN
MKSSLFLRFFCCFFRAVLMPHSCSVLRARQCFKENVN